MKLADSWQDYKVLATGGGEKLESWAGIKLLRPDPQIIWDAPYALAKEKGLHAHYLRQNTGGGAWQTLRDMPEEWTICYGDLRFRVKLMGFKHTGLFPEQAVNWDKMRGLITTHKARYPQPIRVLNLFAYTGGATVACAKAGAFVTHVDAAKGMVERAKDNCKLSGIGANSVRWIVDDCQKFIERELRRGNTYDAVIMDPPSYGRSPTGDVWKLENDLCKLVHLAAQVLSPNPLFFLLNSYTTGLGASVMQNVLNIALSHQQGSVESYELCLPTGQLNIVLPCGNSAWFVGGVSGT